MRRHYFPVKIKNSCNCSLFIVEYKEETGLPYNESRDLISLLYLIG